MKYIYGHKYVDTLVHIPLHYFWFESAFPGLGRLLPKRGNLIAPAYSDILDNSALPTSTQQFVFVFFLFQHDNVPVHTVHP